MDAVKEWWAIGVAIFGAIVWLVRLEGRVNRNSENNQRTEHRLDLNEVTNREQALQLARIEEANKGIKLTVDRIYNQMSASTRILHHTDRTNGPWSDQ
ncbi:MAG: hypothetical protein ACK5LJ_05085 [Paracoccus sp. (in: a-proteobacteria)]